MGRIFTVAFIIALALAVLVGAVRVVAGAQWRPVTVEVDAALLPGKPVPWRSSLTCYWHYYSYNDTVYCAMRSNKAITIGYRTSNQQISSTWIHLERITIGELVLAWGEPVGVSGGNFVMYVYFSGGRAALIGSPYSFYSRAWFVRFEEPEQMGTMKRWRGFANANT